MDGVLILLAIMSVINTFAPLLSLAILMSLNLWRVCKAIILIPDKLDTLLDTQNRLMLVRTALEFGDDDDKKWANKILRHYIEVAARDLDMSEVRLRKIR